MQMMPFTPSAISAVDDLLRRDHVEALIAHELGGRRGKHSCPLLHVISLRCSGYYILYTFSSSSDSPEAVCEDIPCSRPLAALGTVGLCAGASHAAPSDEIRLRAERTAAERGLGGIRRSRPHDPAARHAPRRPFDSRPADFAGRQCLPAWNRHAFHQRIRHRSPWRGDALRIDGRNRRCREGRRRHRDVRSLGRRSHGRGQRPDARGRRAETVDGRSRRRACAHAAARRRRRHQQRRRSRLGRRDYLPQTWRSVETRAIHRSVRAAAGHRRRARRSCGRPFTGRASLAPLPAGPSCFAFPPPASPRCDSAPPAFPKGLRIDPGSGIISGRIHAAGTSRVRIEVRGPGRQGATFAVDRRFGTTLSRALPPMGWNSWNVWGPAVDAAKVLAAAECARKKRARRAWIPVRRDRRRLGRNSRCRRQHPARTRSFRTCAHWPTRCMRAD